MLVGLLGFFSPVSVALALISGGMCISPSALLWVHPCYGAVSPLGPGTGAWGRKRMDGGSFLCFFYPGRPATPYGATARALREGHPESA